MTQTVELRTSEHRRCSKTVATDPKQSDGNHSGNGTLWGTPQQIWPVPQLRTPSHRSIPS